VNSHGCQPYLNFGLTLIRNVHHIRKFGKRKSQEGAIAIHSDCRVESYFLRLTPGRSESTNAGKLFG
jgi:hypothetical protein